MSRRMRGSPQARARSLGVSDFPVPGTPTSSIPLDSGRPYLRAASLPNALRRASSQRRRFARPPTLEAEEVSTKVSAPLRRSDTRVAFSRRSQTASRPSFSIRLRANRRAASWRPRPVTEVAISWTRSAFVPEPLIWASFTPCPLIKPSSSDFRPSTSGSFGVISSTSDFSDSGTLTPGVSRRIRRDIASPSSRS